MHAFLKADVTNPDGSRELHLMYPTLKLWRGNGAVSLSQDSKALVEGEVGLEGKPGHETATRTYGAQLCSKRSNERRSDSELVTPECSTRFPWEALPYMRWNPLRSEAGFADPGHWAAI